MADESKKRATYWVDAQDRDNMAAIRRVYGLASDSAAIRYALQKVAREARTEEQR
jgi:hypothetical protein